MTFPLKPLGQCCSNFMWSLLGQENERLLKWALSIDHNGCHASSEPNKPWALIFAQIMGDSRSTKIAKMMVLCWHFTFLPPRSNLLPHAFVWAIYIYIESIEVTCRSTVVKIVLIGNLRWPSSCLYLLYFSATVLFTCIKSWFVQKPLKKCCITSAVVMSLRWASRGPWASCFI